MNSPSLKSAFLASIAAGGTVGAIRVMMLGEWFAGTICAGAAVFCGLACWHYWDDT